MTTKLWPAVSLSLIVLIGCAGGNGGSTAATTPSGNMTSDSSTVTTGQSGAVAGVLTLEPANGSFGDAKVGARKGITFTVTNPPTNAAFSAILSGANANQFVLAGGTCFRPTRQSSGPANPCTMQVMFMPTSTGAKRASVNVAGSATANLTGNAVAN